MTDFENEFKRRFAEKASSDGLDSEGIWAGIELGLDTPAAAPMVRSRKWGAAGVVAVIALASAAYFYTAQSSETESGIVETTKEQQQTGGAESKMIEKEAATGLTGQQEVEVSTADVQNEETVQGTATEGHAATASSVSSGDERSEPIAAPVELMSNQGKPANRDSQRPVANADADLSRSTDLLTEADQSVPPTDVYADPIVQEQRSSEDRVMLDDKQDAAVPAVTEPFADVNIGQNNSAQQPSSTVSSESTEQDGKTRPADIDTAAGQDNIVDKGSPSEENTAGNAASVGTTPRQISPSTTEQGVELSGLLLNEEVSLVFMQQRQPDKISRATTTGQMGGERLLEDMPTHTRIDLLPTEIDFSLGVNFLESYYRDDLNRLAVYIPQDLDGVTSTIAGRSAAIRGNWHLGEHFRFGLGLEYDGLRSRFDLVTDYADSLLLTDALIGFETDSLGQQSGVFGEQWAPAMSQRTVRHHNDFEMISIPVFIGLQKEFGPLRLGIDAGLAWTMMRSQSGRTLGVSGAVVEFDSSAEDAQLVFSKTGFLTYHARPHLAYRIADGLSLQAAAQLRALPYQESVISGVSRGGLIVGFSGGLIIDLR